MVSLETRYDVAIVGGGHNGLVAACYLAKAGLSVLVLERNAELGGATRSAYAFEGFEAKLSVYSYLVSLFPQKIIEDLGLNLQLKSRQTASYTPAIEGDHLKELLLSNDASENNREAFVSLTGDDSDYRGYLELQAMQESLASVVWPSLTEPLVSREEMRGRLDADGRTAWQSFVEQPLGEVIESKVASDLVRGLVFTDAKIGVSTHPHDSSLLQNRCFLYHVIGRGTGEWRVPVGGMGSLVNELGRVARETGKVTFVTDAKVRFLACGSSDLSLSFEFEEKKREVDAGFVLCNASSRELGRLTGTALEPEKVDEGAGFKVNMLLERLPRLRSENGSSSEAFAGTFHVDEGYEQMQVSYRESMSGEMPATPPGEIYCHSLTDDSILSPELKARGFHTLTLFGLDMPYRLFAEDNEKARHMALERYLAGLNRYLDEPIEDCLAKDTDGKPCIGAMSAVDLENKIHLPKGNIFHGDLTWPFAETEEEVGQWGVETEHPNVFLCGSSARRGGAVSGIPGHNAARKVLEEIA
ncbi:MAG: FAD-dependent oxidoreductase [Opitutae bacterium]|nr:FAD-dependent oxidoreductase [Opitutae bacterium]